MRIPFKCPVCDGTGLVSKPPYVAGDQNEWVTSSCGPYPCHACSGSGIIWSEDVDVRFTNEIDTAGNPVVRVLPEGSK
jgi:hypothetical protein